MPEPRTASVVASRRARASTARALLAAMRRVVTVVPSSTAMGRPVSGASAAIGACTFGNPRAALAGFRLPNLLTAPVSADSREA